MTETERMIKKLVEIRKDWGTIPALIAMAIWLKVEDERVLEMARLYIEKKSCPEDSPDWVRILSNASDVTAIDIAHDDLRSYLEE